MQDKNLDILREYFSRWINVKTIPFGTEYRMYYCTQVRAGEMTEPECLFSGSIMSGLFPDMFLGNGNHVIVFAINMKCNNATQKYCESSN